MTLLETILIGVFSGVLSSLVVLAGTRLVRPAIFISPFISCLPAHPLEAGTPRYQIKIVNRSRRMAMDMVYECVLLSNEGVQARHRIALIGPPPSLLAGKSSRESLNIYRLSIEHDLRAWLEQDATSSIRVRILAKDALTGVGRLREMIYSDPAFIKNGRFEMGDTWSIVSDL